MTSSIAERVMRMVTAEVRYPTAIAGQIAIDRLRTGSFHNGT